MIFLLFILYNTALVDAKFPSDNKVTNDELRKLSNELFSNSRNLFKNISFNYQGRITNENVEDLAPEMFFNTKLEVLDSIPTIKFMRRLYNNFEPEVGKRENKSSEEKMEEDNFISALLETEVMLRAMKFLVDKEFIKDSVQEYKRILKLIWFQLYPRKKNIYGSSGFEHVFLTEKRRKNLLGLHNWIFFAEMELRGRLNYFGHSRHVTLNDKVSLLSAHFAFDGIKKKSSLFIGTLPELEIALYTVCFFAKPGKSCRFAANNSTFSIQTYPMKCEGNDLIGSAFPRI